MTSRAIEKLRGTAEAALGELANELLDASVTIDTLTATIEERDETIAELRDELSKATTK